MKNMIIAACLLITLPAFSVCLINDTASCKVAEIRQPFNKTYSPSLPIVKEYSGSAIKQTKNDTPEKQLREFSPVESDYSYNTSCQFGVCNNAGGVPKLFDNRDKK